MEERQNEEMSCPASCRFLDERCRCIWPGQDSASSESGALPLEVWRAFRPYLDGGILTLAGTEAHVSFDKGKTWKSYPTIPAAKFSFGDRPIERTKDGVIVSIFRNHKEMRAGKKGWGKGTPEEWQIPVYSIRSADNGETWSAPLAIQRDRVGALRAMVVLKGGRIVIATMAIRPWEHVIPVYYSDDQGKSWVKTQTIVMEGSKINDHDGAGTETGRACRSFDLHADSHDKGDVLQIDLQRRRPYLVKARNDRNSEQQLLR